MSDFIKIAVDAMGGDGSPKKIIDGFIILEGIPRDINYRFNFYKFLRDFAWFHFLYYRLL